MPGKHRKNNKGFSLLELLVAVAVLAIIVIPLLHSFVTAAKTNAKAKKIMEATTAGQNVIEEVKSADFSDYVADAVKATIPLSDTDTTPRKDSEGRTLYQYTKEVYPVVVNGRQFRAVVNFNPYDYSTPESGVVEDTDYNSKLFSNLSSLSKANNAFYIQDEAEEINAAKEIDADNYEDVLESMSRKIVFRVEHNAATTVSRVLVSVTYTDERPAPDGTGRSYCPLVDQEIYSNSMELSNTLSNLFICYYPMYNNSSAATPTETIEIDNTSNYKLGVYLVKQTGRDNISPDPYALTRGNYAVNLKVVEGGRTLTKAGEEGGAAVADVVTSVTTNLTYENSVLSQVKLDYDAGGQILPAGYSAADMLDLEAGDLTRKASAVRMYSVTIKVYDEDDTSYEKVLTTIEGTKMQ